MKNLKDGIHSLTVKSEKIIVESNFGKSSMVSEYSLEEYEKAISTFLQLTNP